MYSRGSLTRGAMYVQWGVTHQGGYVCTVGVTHQGGYVCTVGGHTPGRLGMYSGGSLTRGGKLASSVVGGLLSNFCNRSYSTIREKVEHCTILKRVHTALRVSFKKGMLD